MSDSADGYFKEDLKVEVGKFSLDMLDFEDEETKVSNDDSQEDSIVDALKNRKNRSEDEDDD
jgi:hypothetical protein